MIMAIINRGYSCHNYIEIKKRKDVRMDWLGETAHKKSCVLIWKLN